MANGKVVEESPSVSFNCHPPSAPASRARTAESIFPISLIGKISKVREGENGQTSLCSHHYKETMVRPLHAVIIIKRKCSCAQVQILTEEYNDTPVQLSGSSIFLGWGVQEVILGALFSFWMGFYDTNELFWFVSACAGWVIVHDYHVVTEFDCWRLFFVILIRKLVLTCADDCMHLTILLCHQ